MGNELYIEQGNLDNSPIWIRVVLILIIFLYTSLQR